MSYDPSLCPSDLDCDYAKLTTDQLFRSVFTIDENGCLQIRVKTDISIDVDTLNVEVAGVEALLTITNALLTTQAGYVDGLEALLTAIKLIQTDGTQYSKINEVPDSTSAFTLTPYASTALEASHVIKASAGNLFSFIAANNNAALRYVMVFNLTALPANGTVPTLPGLPIQGGGGIVNFDAGKFADRYTTGMVIALSTTQFTLTVAGADALFYVKFN